MLTRLRQPWSDRRAEQLLGALASLLLVLVVGMVLFVLAKAWPSFSHNGLAWFGGGGQTVGEPIQRPRPIQAQLAR